MLDKVEVKNMIKILQGDGKITKTTYRLGQLEQVLEDLNNLGMQITDTKIDLAHKSLDITVHVKK